MVNNAEKIGNGDVNQQYQFQQEVKIRSWEIAEGIDTKPKNVVQAFWKLYALLKMYRRGDSIYLNQDGDVEKICVWQYNFTLDYNKGTVTTIIYDSFPEFITENKEEVMQFIEDAIQHVKWLEK